MVGRVRQVLKEFRKTHPLQAARRTG